MSESSTTTRPVDRAAHEARKYWREQLASVSFEHHIALDHPRPENGRPEYRVLEYRLLDSTHRDLQRLTGGNQFLSFTALLVATKLSCWQYSGNRDVTVFCPSSSESGAQAQLPIHSVLDPDATFKHALLATRGLLSEGYRHDRFPFARLAIDMPAESRPDALPLVASMAELAGDPFDVDCDIAVRFSIGDATAATVRFDARIYDEATIAKFVTLVDGIVAAGVSDVNAHLGELTPHHQAPDAALSVTSTLIHDRVAGRAAEHPERVAIVEGPRVTTYGELERHASELARALSGAGVRRGTRVTVLLDSSIDMVVSMYAVWKAGGIVAPLRPLSITRPIEQVLKALRCAFVLCRGEDVTRLQEACGPAASVRFALVLEYSAATSEYRLEAFEVAPAAGAECDDEPRSSAPAEQRTACVFLDRASSVAVSHAELLSVFDLVNERAGIGAQDRCLFSPSLGACEQLYDTFGMLLAGASVEICNEPGMRESAGLAHRLTSERITVWDLPTGLMLNLLAELHARPGVPRVILLTGEKQSVALANRLRGKLSGPLVMGCYAPPAIGLWTTVFDLSSVMSGPVGRPVPGFEPEVVTGGETIAPVGGKGELLLSRRLSENGSSGSVRTGIRVQRLEDSGLRWLGRDDHRRPRGGCDVELTTLEEALFEDDRIRGAEVRGVAIGSEPSSRDAVAFVLRDAEDGAIEALRARLSEDPRVDLVPDRFHFLHEFPLRADGAIDYETLTKDLIADADGERPMEQLDRAVKRLWRESLDVEVIDEDESFFAAGGNSLKATMLIERIREELGVHISVQRFFRDPTARAVAQLVATESRNGTDEESRIGFDPVSREQYRRVVRRTEP